MSEPERDYGAEAQAAAEKHLEACWAWFHHEQDGEDLPEDLAHLTASPSVGGFCGCDTCEVREVLHAAWPHAVAYADNTPKENR